MCRRETWEGCQIYQWIEVWYSRWDKYVVSNSIEDVDQFSFKVEEKLARKSQAKSWGTFIGWGLMRDRGNPAEARSYSY